jgi:hypothetical protein
MVAVVVCRPAVELNRRVARRSGTVTELHTVKAALLVLGPRGAKRTLRVEAAQGPQVSAGPGRHLGIAH